MCKTCITFIVRKGEGGKKGVVECGTREGWPLFGLRVVAGEVSVIVAHRKVVCALALSCYTLQLLTPSCATE